MSGNITLTALQSNDARKQKENIVIEDVDSESVHTGYVINMSSKRVICKVRFIRRISAMSNAIQTKDNEANHLIIYCLNCI